VNGGMEDWAYAASWDTNYAKDVVPRCKEAHGYPSERSLYTPSMLRVLNILIETSDSKAPSESSLGSSHAVFLPSASDNAGNGHVPRNIRLILNVGDAVEPYVEWDGTLPNLSRTPAVVDRVPGGWLWAPRYGPAKSLHVRWRVGGAYTVDSTELLVGCLPREQKAEHEWWKDWQAAADAAPGTLDAMVAARATEGTIAPAGIHAQGATGRWGHQDLRQWDVFEAEVPVRPEMCPGGNVFVMARAMVDSTWGTAPTTAQPTGRGPQSHYSNARTNPDWHHTLGDQVVQGRVHWYSPPLVLDRGRTSPLDQMWTQRQRLEERIEPLSRHVKEPHIVASFGWCLALAAAATAACILINRTARLLGLRPTRNIRTRRELDKLGAGVLVNVVEDWPPGVGSGSYVAP